MKKELTDKVRISHVLDAIGEVETYLKGVSFEDFLDNSEKRFATIKQIEIIGEACNRMTMSFKKEASGNQMEGNQWLQKYICPRVFRH